VADKKQNALVDLVREIVRERGFASPAGVDAFLEAGYQRPQVMELLLGVVEDGFELPRSSLANHHRPGLLRKLGEIFRPARS